jgi:hypothetical protein
MCSSSCRSLAASGSRRASEAIAARRRAERSASPARDSCQRAAAEATSIAAAMTAAGHTEERAGFGMANGGIDSTPPRHRIHREGEIRRVGRGC